MPRLLLKRRLAEPVHQVVIHPSLALALLRIPGAIALAEHVLQEVLITLVAGKAALASITLVVISAGRAQISAAGPLGNKNPKRCRNEARSAGATLLSLRRIGYQHHAARDQHSCKQFLN